MEEEEDMVQLSERPVGTDDSLKAEPRGWLMDWVWDEREKNGA